MKQKKLTFVDIQNGYPIFENTALRSIKGGRNIPSEVSYAVDSNGDIWELILGGDWTNTYISIEEVEIVANRPPGFSFTNLYSLVWQNSQWYANGYFNISSHGGGGGGGGSSYTPPPPSLPPGFPSSFSVFGESHIIQTTGIEQIIFQS